MLQFNYILQEGDGDEVNPQEIPPDDETNDNESETIEGDGDGAEESATPDPEPTGENLENESSRPATSLTNDEEPNESLHVEEQINSAENRDILIIDHGDDITHETDLEAETMTEAEIEAEEEPEIEAETDVDGEENPEQEAENEQPEAGSR